MRFHLRSRGHADESTTAGASSIGSFALGQRRPLVRIGGIRGRLLRSRFTFTSGRVKRSSSARRNSGILVDSTMESSAFKEFDQPREAREVKLWLERGSPASSPAPPVPHARTPPPLAHPFDNPLGEAPFEIRSCRRAPGVHDQKHLRLLKASRAHKSSAGSHPRQFPRRITTTPLKTAGIL
jgi:hypothetical protein